MSEFVIIYNNKEEHICINTKIFAKFTDIMDTKDDVPYVEISGNKITIIPDVDHYVLKLIANYINLHCLNIEQEQIPVEVPLISSKLSKIYTNSIDVKFFTSVSDNINQLVLAAHVLNMVTLRLKALACISTKIKEKYVFKDEDNIDMINIITKFTSYMSVLSKHDGDDDGVDDGVDDGNLSLARNMQTLSIARSIITGKSIGSIKKNKLDEIDELDKLDEIDKIDDSDIMPPLIYSDDET